MTTTISDTMFETSDLIVSEPFRAKSKDMENFSNETLAILKLITSIIAPIFTLALAILGAFTEKREEREFEDGERKVVKKVLTTYGKTIIILLILAAFTTLSGIWVDDLAKKKSAAEKKLQDLENVRKRDSILNVATAVLDSVNNTLTAVRKIQNASDSTATKLTTLYSLQKQTMDQVTGGKSVPKLTFSTENNYCTLILSNNTKLPIKAVKTKVIFKTEKYSDQAGTTVQKEVFDEYDGDMGVGFVQIRASEQLPKDYQRIQCIYTVSWANGFYQGGFLISNGNGKNKIEHALINIFTAGFDYSKAVKINGEFSEVLDKPIYDIDSFFK